MNASCDSEKQSGEVLFAEYRLKQTVFLVTDDDQKARIVSSITFSANGSCQYQLSCGTTTSWHYACEMSSEKNLLSDVGSASN